MDKLRRRKTYLVHPSSQLKFILIGVLPAFVIAIFCLQVLFVGGALIIEKERQNVAIKAAQVNNSVSKSVEWLVENKYPNEVVEITGGLLKELISLEAFLQKTYYGIVKQWTRIKLRALGAVVLILGIVAFLALIYSHRIVGALYRLRRDAELLAAGKDVPAIKLRKHDEFKELAASLDKIRRVMKEKGLLS